MMNSMTCWCVCKMSHSVVTCLLLSLLLFCPLLAQSTESASHEGLNTNNDSWSSSTRFEPQTTSTHNTTNPTPPNTPTPTRIEPKTSSDHNTTGPILHSMPVSTRFELQSSSSHSTTGPTPPNMPTSTRIEPESSRDSDTVATTQHSTPKDTTTVITYAALVLAALLLLSCVCVGFRKLRRKGCPRWCPPPCRDLECGQPKPTNTITASSNNKTTTTTTTTTTKQTNDNNNDSNTEKNGTTGDDVDGGGGGDGGSGGGSGGMRRGVCNGHTIVDKDMPYASFHKREYLRHKSSLASLVHQPSFGNLENIFESEEETSSLALKPGNMDLREAFSIIDKRLQPLSRHHGDNTNVTSARKLNGVASMTNVPESSRKENSTGNEANVISGRKITFNKDVTSGANVPESSSKESSERSEANEDPSEDNVDNSEAGENTRKGRVVFHLGNMDNDA